MQTLPLLLMLGGMLMMTAPLLEVPRLPSMTAISSALRRVWHADAAVPDDMTEKLDRIK